MGVNTAILMLDRGDGKRRADAGRRSSSPRGARVNMMPQNLIGMLAGETVPLVSMTF